MATQKERDLWMCYVVNHRQHLKNEIRELQATLRYRDIDPIDCLELMLALERLNCFNEYVKHTTEIFKIIRGNELQNGDSE